MCCATQPFYYPYFWSKGVIFLRGKIRENQPWKSCPWNNHPCQAKKAKPTHKNIPLLSDVHNSTDEDYMDTEASDSESSTDEDKDLEVVITHEEVQNYVL